MGWFSMGLAFFLDPLTFSHVLFLCKYNGSDVSSICVSIPVSCLISSSTGISCFLCPLFFYVHMFYCNSYYLSCLQLALCGTTLCFILCLVFLLSCPACPHLVLCDIIIFARTISAYLLCMDCSVLHLSLSS
jgi:hypothetical protein